MWGLPGELVVDVIAIYNKMTMASSIPIDLFNWIELAEW